MRAGRRLPQAWLTPDRSIFDELGSGMSLLLFTAADPGPLAKAAAAQSVPLTVVELAHTDLAVGWGTEAALVRPDQYVAWSGSLYGLDASAVLARIRGAT